MQQERSRGQLPDTHENSLTAARHVTSQRSETVGGRVVGGRGVCSDAFARLINALYESFCTEALAGRSTLGCDVRRHRTSHVVDG